MTILSAAISKALNHGKHSSFTKGELEQVMVSGLSINDHIEPIIRKIHDVNKDNNLSSTGKDVKTTELVSDAITILAAIDQRELLANHGQKLKADSFNRVAQAELAMQPEGQNAIMGAAFDRMAILNVSAQADEKARATHEEKVRQAQINKVPLSDNELNFTPPSESKFLEACQKGVTTQTASYLQACRYCPYPIELVSQEALAAGQAILEKITSPALHAAIVSNQRMQATTAILMDEAANLLKQPLNIVLESGNPVIDGITEKVSA